MRNKLRGESGAMAMLLVIAFMALSIPLITTSLSLSTVLSVDSKVKTQILNRQYCALAAMEYLRYVASDPTRWNDFVSAYEVGISICPEMTLSVSQLLGQPAYLPFISSKKHRLFTTNLVDNKNDTVSIPGGIVEYTVTVENKHRKSVNFKKLVDELPDGFSHEPGTTTLKRPDGTTVPLPDPVLKAPKKKGENAKLEWTIPTPNKLQPGEKAIITFSAKAALDIGDGVYCNEVNAEKGGKKTRSGMTAKVTIGIGDFDQRCEGTAVSVWKEVSPEVAFPDTSTTYTYSIFIKNEGTRILSLKEIKDYVPDNFTIVPETTVAELKLASKFESSAVPPQSPTDQETKIKNKHKKKEDGPFLTEIKWKFKKDNRRVVPPGETWILTYETTTDFPKGFYAAEVDIKFDKGFTLVPVAGPEGPGLDLYTYTIPIENDGTEALGVEEIKIKLAKDLAFDSVTGVIYEPVTNDPSDLPPGQPTDQSDKEIKWIFGGSGVMLDPGAKWEWTLKIKADDGSVASPIKVEFIWTAEDDKEARVADRVTGPTAVITVAEVHRVTINVAGDSFECDVWFVSDEDVGEYQILEGCAF